MEHLACTGSYSWSELPGDLLSEIAARVMTASADDVTAFRKVCTSWRAAATKDIFKPFFSKPWPSVPYVMLPEKEGSHDREFYSLISNKIFMTSPLPEAHGKRCIEVRFGWLLTLTNSGEAKLLNPITRSQIDLPDLNPFPNDHDRIDHLVRSTLSANPSSSSDFVLAVVRFGFGPHLQKVWKNGDENWTEVYLPEDNPRDVIYHIQDQKFYLLGCQSCLYVLDPSVNFEAKTILKVPSSGLHKREDKYLVESSAGELLMVTRNGVLSSWRKKTYTYGASKFRVFRVDFDKNNYQEITSLENEAIFVGHNAAFSIPASGGIKPNSIYFSDDSIEAYCESLYTCSKCGFEADARLCKDREKCEINYQIEWEETEYENSGLVVTEGGGKNMGIYNLENGCIERFHQSVERLSFICPPMWVSLSSVLS